MNIAHEIIKEEQLLRDRKKKEIKVNLSCVLYEELLIQSDLKFNAKYIYRHLGNQVTYSVKSATTGIKQGTQTCKPVTRAPFFFHEMTI